MAEELLDRYINRQSIEADTKFFLDQLGAVKKFYDELKDIRISISGASSTKELVAGLKDADNAIKGTSKSISDLDKTTEGLATELKQAATSAKELGKTGSEAASTTAKSFTQFSDAVEANIAKQKALKKELENIKDTQKQLTELNAKINFEKNPQAQAAFEKELIAFSERELQIRKQIADLNKEIKDGNTNGVSPVSTAEARQIALEREQLRLKNAELKASVQLELANANSIDEARAAIAQLTRERNALNLSTEQGVARQAELNAQIDKYNAFVKTSVDKQGAQRLNVGNYVSAGGFTDAFNVLSKQLDEVKVKLKDPALSGKDLDSLKNQEKLLVQLTENLNTQFKSTREELRAYQEAAKSLGVTLGDDNQTFNEFATAVGGAKDELSDLQARINFNSSDTKYIEGAIQAVNGLAGAYSVAEGAAQLFGSDNEDLQRGMQKLQALIAITTGLQQVQNVIQSESAAMQTILAAKTGLLAIAQRILGTSTAANVIATEADVAATAELGVAAEGATVAIAEEVVATEAATAATGTFAAAFAATGIGAAILAVGAALVYAAYKLKEFVGQSKDAYDNNVLLTASIKDQSDALQKQGELIDVRNKAGITSAKNELDLASTLGETRQKELDQKGKLIEQQKKLADSKLGFEIAEAEKQYSEAGVKGVDALNLAQTGYLAKYRTYVSQILLYQDQLNKSRSAKDDDGIKEAEGRIADLQKEMDGTKAAYDRITAVKDDAAAADLETQQHTNEQTRLNRDESRKLALSNAQLEADIVKIKNDKILNNEKSTQEQRIAALRSNAEAERAIITAQKNDVLTNPESSDNDRLIAVRKASAEYFRIRQTEKKAEQDLNLQYENRKAAAVNETNKIRIEAEKKLEEAILANQYEGLQKRLDVEVQFNANQKELIEQDYQFQKRLLGQKDTTSEEYEALEASKDAKLVQLATDSQKKITEIYKSEGEKQRQLGERFIEFLNSTNVNDVSRASTYSDESAALNKSLSEKTITYKKYNEERQRIDEQYIIDSTQAEIDKVQNILKVDDESHLLSFTERNNLEVKLYETKDRLSKKYIDNEIANQQKLKEAYTQLSSTVVDLFGAIIDNGYEREKQEIIDTQKVRDENYQKELDNLSSSSLTDDQKTARRIELIAQEDAAKKISQSKQEELDRKKAKTDRLIQIAQITGNATQTVFKLIADAALAKAQAALLAANPLTVAFAPMALASAAAIGALIPITIGTAAAQIAKLALPKFKDGKGNMNNYQGFAWVGDGNRSEAIIREDGSVEKTPATATLTYLKSKDVVMPDYNSFVSNISTGKTDTILKYSTDKVTVDLAAKAINTQTRVLKRAIESSNKKSVLKVIYDPNFKIWVDQSVRHR